MVMIQQRTNNNLFSEREVAIMQFIHEFGYCDVRHIMKKFQLGRSSAYAYMKMLVRFGMVKYVMVLPNCPGVYFLTVKAVRLINSDLPLLTYVPIHHYFHFIEVLRVYLATLTKHPDGTWITERRLIREKCEDMAGNKEHLPDGILILPDEKRIAIEVELTAKGRDRLLTILTDYVVDKAIHEVWYFCSKKVWSLVTELSINLPKIKIYLIDEECV